MFGMYAKTKVIAKHNLQPRERANILPNGAHRTNMLEERRGAGRAGVELPR